MSARLISGYKNVEGIIACGNYAITYYQLNLGSSTDRKTTNEIIL